MFPGSDPNCVKASGFFYGSLNCQLEIIGNVLPVVHMRSYYQRWLKTQPKAKPAPAQPIEPVIYPAKMKTPAANGKTPEQDLRDALAKIDPLAISYTDWVRVLMALHHDLGDAGLPIAEAWGKGKENEIRGKWRSFKSNGNGNAVTLKTVFGMAQAH